MHACMHAYVHATAFLCLDYFYFRLFFGKNKVLQVALGTQPSTECLDNVHKIAKLLVGERGILITKEGLKETKKILSSVTGDEFAKAGFTATKTIVLEVPIHPNAFRCIGSSCTHEHE